MKELQLKLKAWLYEYGWQETSNETGLSKYFLNKVVNDASPNLDLVEKLKNHFENKETEKLERLEKILG